VFVWIKLLLLFDQGCLVTLELSVLSLDVLDVLEVTVDEPEREEDTDGDRTPRIARRMVFTLIGLPNALKRTLAKIPAPMLFLLGDLFVEERVHPLHELRDLPCIQACQTVSIFPCASMRRNSARSLETWMSKILGSGPPSGTVAVYDLMERGSRHNCWCPLHQDK
jgi:hypothetical protein